MSVIRVGIIGAGWMGRAHAAAFESAIRIFGTEPAVLKIVAVADVNEDIVRDFAERFDVEHYTTDWRSIVNDPNIDVIDITTPNDKHPDIALAAIAAGKHVYCEKPMANTASEARQMREAAEAAGVVTMVGFNYLCSPIQAYARQLIQSGALGDIFHFRGMFDNDYMLGADFPFTWRSDAAVAGRGGALADMASHVLSLAHYLVGDVTDVCGTSQILHQKRKTVSGATRTVENDDLAQFVCRFENGASGYVEASRIGTGRKLYLAYEIQGTKGSLLFDQERMNELYFYNASDDPAERGYKRILSAPEHPDYAAFYGLQGNPLGYNDLKIIEARRLIESVALGKRWVTDFNFGYRVDRVIDAVLMSIDENRWVNTGEIE
ncbi:Gfo/Idh/MocA family protein [Enterobacter cloacae complex sp. 2024EL-00215]|uniref:Gfo/Idh/MocA family protein n=1 Tax=unclassified Enterobacter cloacae complex TaxID=2757714 RepID=UPI00375276A4